MRKLRLREVNNLLRVTQCQNKNSNPALKRSFNLKRVVTVDTALYSLIVVGG